MSESTQQALSLDIYYPHPYGLITSAIFRQNYTSKAQLHRLQQFYVRILLQHCTKYRHPNFILNDKQYPYTLTPLQTHQPHYFVSFSHSKNYVALALSPYPCAIDVELRTIKKTIAQRFFYPQELQLLDGLNAHTQQIALGLLWQLKECLAKITGNGLSKTLSQNLSSWVQLLLSQPTQTHFHIPPYTLIRKNPTLVLIKTN